jgi:hypothetical protein
MQRRVLRHRHLRAALNRLLRASIPVLALGCEDGSAVEETVRIYADRPPYVDLVADCRADDLACDPLCQKVLGAQGEDPSYLTLHECRFRDLTGGMAEVEMTYSYPPEACGRRPPGWSPSAVPAAGALSAYLARCAELEHASVFAFLRLARELEDSGAPAPLPAAARRAALDEVRHTALMGGLARWLGAEPASAQVIDAAPRDLAAIAEDNAAEGGAREAFGAALATWQAAHATDLMLRAAMAIIAPDERRHARLAAQVDRFLRPRLTRTAARRVGEARRAAIADLAADLAGAEPDPTLGLPTPEVAARLLKGAPCARS